MHRTDEATLSSITDNLEKLRECFGHWVKRPFSIVSASRVGDSLMWWRSGLVSSMDRVVVTWFQSGRS